MNCPRSSKTIVQFPRNAGAKSSWTMMWAACGVCSLPTRSMRVAASNSKAFTSSGESTPFSISLRTNACRMRTSSSPCASEAGFSVMMLSRIVGRGSDQMEANGQLDDDFLSEVGVGARRARPPKDVSPHRFSSAFPEVLNLRVLLQPVHRVRRGEELSLVASSNVCAGSNCEELNVSKSSPLSPTIQTSTRRADTSQWAKTRNQPQCKAGRCAVCLDLSLRSTPATSQAHPVKSSVTLLMDRY